MRLVYDDVSFESKPLNYFNRHHQVLLNDLSLLKSICMHCKLDEGINCHAHQGLNQREDSTCFVGFLSKTTSSELSKYELD